MKLLLVAATAAEVQPLIDSFASPIPRSAAVTRYRYGRHQIDVLLSGVGMVATATWCGRTLADARPDIAFNLGVCGSFNPDLPPATVVHVVSDCLPELGAEDGEQFLTIHDLGLLGADESPYQGGRLTNPAPPTIPTLTRLPVAHGITVNTVHGHEASIRQVVERWLPDVESMEGAAFMYACLTADVPFAQIRAVSNRVERRNRSAWRLGDAVVALTETATRMLSDL
jgi:futalosine hydrolase